ncbi:MAG: hypothetical protein ACJ76Y_05940 [Thermoanaerobaculia bacterium]
MVVVLAFVVVLLASALGGSAQAVAPAPVDPALVAVFAANSGPQASGVRKSITCGPFCDTSIHETTAVISGSGSDCTTAQSSLTSQLQTIARGQCQNFWGDLNYCQLVVHTTTACTLIAPGTWQIQGYATYSCRDTTC